LQNGSSKGFAAMKAHHFTLPALATLFAVAALACGSGAETETETEQPGTSTENLTLAASADLTPAAPATTQAPVEQAAPQHGGGVIDGNKDCGGWCHDQCCGDTCTTADAVTCVASCIKYMCMPQTKTRF
jgi:hypothetical protein